MSLNNHMANKDSDKQPFTPGGYGDPIFKGHGLDLLNTHYVYYYSTRFCHSCTSYIPPFLLFTYLTLLFTHHSI